MTPAAPQGERRSALTLSNTRGLGCTRFALFLLRVWGSDLAVLHFRGLRHLTSTYTLTGDIWRLHVVSPQYSSFPTRPRGLLGTVPAFSVYPPFGPGSGVASTWASTANNFASYEVNLERQKGEILRRVLGTGRNTQYAIRNNTLIPTSAHWALLSMRPSTVLRSPVFEKPQGQTRTGGRASRQRDRPAP